MQLNIFFSFLLMLSFCGQAIYADSPTTQFLQKHSLDSIESTIKAQGDEGFDTDTFFPFFLSVIEQENEHCFGYHATTAAHMIFQETVRITLEELYGYTFPADFYFLRCPDPRLPSHSSAHEYIQQFSRKELFNEEMYTFVDSFFTWPLEQESALHVTPDDAADIADVYRALLSFAPVAPVLNKSPDEVRQILWQYIASSAVDAKSLEIAFKEWINDPLGAYQEHECYSDHEFMNAILYPYDDTDDTQQALLSSLNISLFGNYFISSESTAHVFAKASSVALSKSAIRAKTGDFFGLVGLDATVADDIYAFAKNSLKIKGGVLLQFFDKGLSNINNAAFVCSGFGVPDCTISPSELVSDLTAYTCEEGDVPLLGHVVVHPQLRLVAIPTSVLNPFSWLEIKCHDLISPEAKIALREYIRGKVRSAEIDGQKSESYREYLQTIWQ